MTTHADLVAAVEKARYHAATPIVRDRDAHCDDLAALLSLHSPMLDGNGIVQCLICRTHSWPCLTVAIVTDRLTAWGAL